MDGDSRSQKESTYVEPTGPCTGSTVASTYQRKSMNGFSDLARHLASFFLPVAAVIALRIWRKSSAPGKSYRAFTVSNN